MHQAVLSLSLMDLCELSVMRFSLLSLFIIAAGSPPKFSLDWSKRDISLVVSPRDYNRTYILHIYTYVDKC